MNLLAKTAPLRQSGVPVQGVEFSQALVLPEPSRVYLDIGVADISEFSRIGNDLVLVVCGDVIRIAGFFLPEAQSQLFLRGSEGQALEVLLDTAGLDGQIIARFIAQPEAAPFESLTAPAACLIAPESGSSLTSLGTVLGTVLAGGALAAGASRSSSGSDAPAVPLPDTRAPQFLSASVSADGAVLTLIYDETLDAARPPTAASFVVQVNGVAVAVTGVSVVGASVVLTLAGVVPRGALVSVGYADPTPGNDANAVQDAAGNDAASLPTTSAAHAGGVDPGGDLRAPVFVSAATSTDGASVVLTYDEALDPANPPAVGSFVVMVDGVALTVTGLRLVGAQVVLTLAAPVRAGEVVTVAYADPSSGNDSNAIQDAAGNDAATLGSTAVDNRVAAPTAPNFVSAATSADGGALVLTYDEALDAANPPAVGSFVVTVNGVAVEVTGLRIVGSTVVLTLAAPVVQGAVVTVAYTDPSGGNDADAVQDAAGNDASSLPPTGVANLVGDSTPPVFVSAATSADGGALVLTYDEALDAANPPAVGSFVVRVNGAVVEVTGLRIVGSSVVLTLAAPVVQGAVATVAYTDPSGGNDANAVQDAAGNDASSLSPTGVANLVGDARPPAFVSAATSADGLALVLTYDEALDAANPPAVGSFVVRVNGAVVEVTGLRIVGSTVVLTLAAPVVQGALVTVAYTDASGGNDANAVQDAAGNDASSLPPTGVANLVGDSTPPVFVSAATSADGRAVVLTYGEALDAARPPAPESFVVTVNGVPVRVTGVSVSGSTVVLALASAVASGAVVTVAYSDPTAGNDGSAIQDAAGNDAASLAQTGVSNLVSDGITPTFVSAATSADGLALVLTYDKALDAGHPPAPGSFVVMANGATVAVARVTVVGSTVVLTLADAVRVGALVTVAYNDATPGNDVNAIQDAAGNDAASLAATSVLNLAIDAGAPSLLSALTSSDGTTVVLSYNEALDAAHPPDQGSFTVRVNGVDVQVTAVAVAGSRVLLTLAAPVPNGAAVTVTYDDPTPGNDGNAIQDDAGNDAASLQSVPVGNLVADGTPPAFVSAATSADGTRLVLGFGEPLDPLHPPLAGSFVVRVNGLEVGVAGVAIQGANVVLTLAAVIPRGAAVTFDYNDTTPGNDGSAIQDAFGNDAPSLLAVNVSNLVADTRPPAFVSAATSSDGTSLVLTFDEALAAGNPPAMARFAVKVDGTDVAVTGLSVVASTVVLTLAVPVPRGAGVTVAYDDSTPGDDGSVIQDVAGNDAASLAPTAVNNLVADAITPTFVSAATSSDGNTLELTYDEALDAVAAPGVGSFVVKVNGVEVGVTRLEVSGSSVVLVLATRVPLGAVVTVAYTDPSGANDANAVQDVDGNDAATLLPTAVTNLVADTEAPTFVSAVTGSDGATLVLGYSEALDAAHPPAPDSFVVLVNGVRVAVSGLVVEGASLVLTLASPVLHGASVTVSYDDTTAGNDVSAIQDLAGNDALSLATTGVSNIVPDTGAPVLVSAATTADGAALVLTYSEGLDSANPPPVGSFVVNVNGARVAVTGVAVVGNNVVLTLESAVPHGVSVNVAYVDASAGNDVNAIQDTSGNDAASLPTTAVGNLVADTRPPAFVTATTSADGGTLVLAYDEALDGANLPAQQSFEVLVNGARVAVTGVAVAGSSVLLTLASAVPHGAVVTVAYADAGAGNDLNALQDAAGNDAASLPATPVANLVPDSTPPAFVSAVTSADGATLELTYSETLDSAHPPALGSFVVRVNGVEVGVTALTVAGSRVLLTLAKPVVQGTAVTVAYNDVSAGNDISAIQDAAGNDAATLPTTSVGNAAVDATAPSFVSAATSADGLRLVLTYSEALDAARPPDSSRFEVRVDAAVVAVSGLDIVGDTVVLTLAGAVTSGAAVTVGYTDPSGSNDALAVQDAAGNDAATLPATNVSNLVADTTAPAFVSAVTSADGATLVLSYNEALDAGHPPDLTSFVVRVDGLQVAVTGLVVAGASVVLTLQTPVAHGAQVTLAYVDPTGDDDIAAIQDAAGNDAADLATTNVSNAVADATPPTFVSAVTSADGATLVLTYSETLDAGNVPPPGSFLVDVNGASVGVGGVAVLGSSVVLTLAAPVPHGAAVTVAYVDPSSSNDAKAIQDAAGNDAASLPATSVGNLVPDGTPPVFVSAATSSDGATLVLNYSEALDATRPPVAGDFVVKVNGVEVGVSGVAIAGSGVVLTLAAPVAHGAALTVAYNDPSPVDDDKAIQDASGNDAATLAATSVSNLVPDGVAPAFVSAVTSADGLSVVLGYSEALDSANLPPAGSFTVNVNGLRVALASVAVSGSSVVLTLESAVAAGAAVTVAYGDPTPTNDPAAIQDVAGNDAASLPLTNVSNLVADGTAPVFVAAATSADGARIVLTYSEALDAAQPPLAGSFTVQVNGVDVEVTRVAVVGAGVVLTLASAVAHGAAVSVAYADPSGGNDAGAIQDAAGNDAANLPATSVSNLVPDGTAPALVSAVTSTDGATLVLTYNEALDAGDGPGPGSFLVQVNGVTVNVSTVTVVGSTLRLALETPVTHAAVVNLSYTDPTSGNDSNVIQDVAGNDAQSLAAIPVSNAVPDGTAPVFVSAVTSADGRTLVLTYNEALDADRAPVAGDFVVRVNGVLAEVTGVSVVGSSVRLALANAVGNGAAVTVAYSDPSPLDETRAIQDLAGNDAADLGVTNVSNLVADTKAPGLVSAVTSSDGRTLVLSYDEALDAANPPALGSFVVRVNGVQVALSNVDVSGSRVLLQLAAPVAHGLAVTVDYSAATPGDELDAIQDAAGNDAAGFTALPVGNLVPDNVAPVFVSAVTSADGSQVVLTFGEALDEGAGPGAERFTVRVDGVLVGVTDVAVLGHSVRLTLASPVPHGAAVTVEYVDLTAGNDVSAIQDAAGNDAPDLSTHVSNLVADTTPPAFVMAATSVDGTQLVLTYSEALDAAHPPTDAGFTVNVGGLPVGVTNVAVVGSTVVLTLQAPVPTGAAVTVAYADPLPTDDIDAVQDMAGNDAATLPATNASNLVPDGTPPAFISAATSTNGLQLVLTYSEALDADHPPIAASFTVLVNGVNVGVAGASIVGSNVVLALAAPIAHGAAVSVAYGDPSAANDANAVQDRSGNDAASLATTSVNNLVPDGTAPTFLSAATTADGTQLVLIYDDDLDATMPAAPTSFVVNVDGAQVAVSALQVIGSTVRLTLAAPVSHGAGVTVAYNDPSGGDDALAIQNGAGLDAATLLPIHVNNLVADTAAPTFVSAATSADGSALVLTYSEALDGTSLPAAGAFTVRVNGVLVNVTNVQVAGSALALTLESSVAHGAAVSVAYADPTPGNDGNAIQDAAGNDAASLATTGVSNLVADTRAPVFVAAATSSDGSTLVLTYDEVLDAANAPGTANFSVLANGVSIGVGSVAVVGNTVVLTLAAPVAHGQTVGVTYSAAASAIQDAAGNDAANLVAEAVNNLVPDNIAPTLLSAVTTTDGTAVVLTYDDMLDALRAPTRASFVVRVDGVPVTIDSLQINGAALTLALESPIAHGAIVTVDYTDPTAGDDAAAIQDSVGNDAQSLTALGVTNQVPDAAAPVFVSATTTADGSALLLTYSEALDAAQRALATDFEVTVNGVTVPVTAVTVAGSVVRLTLDAPVANGAAVTVAYLDRTAGNDLAAIQDAAGNDAASLPVTNVNNTVADTAAPVFVSAVTGPGGGTLVLGYSEALDAAHAPLATSFSVMVNGSAVDVTGVAIAGNSVVLTLATAVPHGAAVTVGYADASAGNDLNAIQDAAGNDAASLAATAVSNLVPDTQAPVFVAATTSIDGAGIVLSYNEALDAQNPPVAADFVVRVDGALVAVALVTVSGSQIVLALESPLAHGAAVTVAYIDPSLGDDGKAIQDVAGNDGASLAPTNVSNLVPDIVAPTFVSAATGADGSSLVLTYDEALDATNPPEAGRFVVRVNGVEVGVSAVSVAGTTLVLALAAPVASGAAVSVAYTDPSGGNDLLAVQDAAGNDAASLAPTNVSNLVPDDAAPVFVSAVTSADGAALVLTYDEALDPGQLPDMDSFVVRVNGTDVAVSGVAVSGRTVELTLATAVGHGAAVTVAYVDPSGGNDLNAIQDTAGNDAASLPATSVSNVVPDTTAPVLISAVSSTDGTTLVLNYSETLDATHLPGAQSFTVQVGGANVQVTGVAIAGSSVLLTLADALPHGAAVTVAYADPSASDDLAAIQDAAGNDAVSLPATSVGNLVPDTTPPAFVSAVTGSDGATLVLNYSETLDPAHAPLPGRFTVTVNGASVGVSAVAISGSSAVLTLAAPVPHGAGVTVAYNDASPGNDLDALQDAAGNDAATLPATSVSNLVADTTPPAFVSAVTSADGATLVLHYNEALDAAHPPAVGSFVVNVNGVAVGVASVAIAGANVVLTLASAVAHGASVTVSYADPSGANDAGAIQDAAGNDAASLPLTSASNLVPDTTPPALVSAVTSADGAALVLNYNEALDAAHPPGAASFTVLVDGSLVGVAAVAVAGSSVLLTLDRTVPNGAAVSVAYADPTGGNDINAVQDAAGNDAATLPATSVGNLVPDTTPPVLVSAATSANGASVVLTYGETLDAGHAPPVASFVVNVNGALVAVTATAISGATVVLTLASPVPHGASVDVAYLDPSAGNDLNAIQDAAGNDAAALPATAVSNLVPDTTAPVFVSATTSTDGATLVLSYSEALDAAHAPAAGSFAVNVNGAPVPVSAVAVDGANVVLTLATAVAHGAAVTVGYVDPTAGNDISAVQDAAGNDAASLPATGVANAVPDTTPPAFVSAATSTDGASLVLGYNEALDAGHAPAPGSFVVNVNGAPVTVTGVAVDGANLVLTLASAVPHGAAVSVAYTDPSVDNDVNAIQDALGNDALSLPVTTVTNLVPDTTPPAFVSAATGANGTTLVLSYSETLDAGNAPLPARFAVSVDGAAVGVTAVTIVGSSAVLTLAAPVVHGASVTVAYTDPSAGNDSLAIQDGAGNDALTLPATSVTNLVPDTLAPTVQITVADLLLASGESSLVTFSFSEAVTGFDAGDVSAAGGLLTGLTQVNPSTWTALFTQDGSSTQPSVSIAAGAYTDLALNPGAGYTLDAALGWSADIVAPTLLITAADLALARGEATLVTFTFSEAVAGFAQGDVTALGGSLTSFTQLNARTWTAIFTQDGTATPPSLSVGAGAYTDIAANPGLAYTLDAAQGFAADITPPVLQSQATNASGLEIRLVYNEALDPAHPPLAASFVVNVNGAPRAVSSVTVAGNSVVLGLASAVVFGNSVTVSYTDPSGANDANAAQDIAGNDAAGFAAQPVLNNVPSSDLTPPQLVITAQDLLLARGEATSVTFEFSESVLGFTAGDVLVAGGALSAFTQIDSNTWTALFTQDGTATPPSISVANGSFTDAAANPGLGYALNAATGLTADIVAPTLLSAATGAGGTTLVLTYSEALDPAHPPAAGQFVVSVGGTPVAVSAAAVVGSTVVLTLASAATNGATVTVGYNDATAGNDANAVQDLAGNDAATRSNVAVTDAQPPVLQSASVTGSTLTLTYDEALGTPTAAPSSFVVNANGASVAVTNVAVSGSTVVLTLAGAVAAGAVVTVGYTDTTPGNDVNAVQDTAGNDAASLVAAPVTNTQALIQVDEDDIAGTLPALANGAFVGLSANATFTLSAPVGALTSGGQTIVWTGAGTATLTGHVGTAAGAVAVVVGIASGGADAGKYTVSLFKPLDHALANAEDLRNFNVGVLVNGAAGNLQLTVGVVDDVPVATPASTQVFTAAGTQQGNAALTFGADGGYVRSVTVDGLQYSYNPTAKTVTQTGSSTSVYAYAYDNQSTLTVNTLRGETFTIDLASGQYSMSATGQRASIAANVAPVANLGEAGGLLGLVSANALGLINLSAQQAFTASDANNNIREVSLVFGGLSVGTLLFNPWRFSATLAAELGLRVDYSTTLLTHTLRISSTTSGQPVDNFKLNELLGSITLNSSLLNILTLDLASSLSMTVTDQAGLTDTATGAELLNLQLLRSLVGTQPPGLEVGTTGADTLDGADGLAAGASRRLYGFAGNDTLQGNLGNDILRGGAGNDTLNGLAGNDILVGGGGADTMTGGSGLDVFRWEAGDAGAEGTPVIDTIMDFDVNSVWAGGDVLHLASLLSGEGRLGFTTGNLANYLHFAKVGNDTVISISSQGGFVGGYNAANAARTDQQIVLKNVDLVTGYGTDSAIITHLLGQGKLEVDSAAINAGGLDGTTDVGFSLIDRDGDTAAGSVTFDTSAVNAAAFNPNNRAPEVQIASSALLGIIGVNALNAINLSEQNLTVVDRDRNLSQVQVRYQPLLALNLTPLQLTASQSLATELGLQLRVQNNPGVLNVLAPTSTLVITSLVAGAVIGNQAINELLASVHLTDQSGTLLNGALLSADVLNALTITATDSQGASSTGTVSQLLAVNLASNLNGNANLQEGTNAGDAISGTAGADRLYGHDGNDTLQGGDGDDLLRGGAGDDILDGGNGNDLLIGGLGSDTFIGGAGDDTIELLSPTYASISGGTGFDTLLLDGGINLTFTAAPTRISGIERVDLGTGDSGSVLTLTAQAVLELTDGASHTLQIVGDALDRVVMAGAVKGPTTVVGDVNFVSYAWAGAVVLVEQEVSNVVV